MARDDFNSMKQAIREMLPILRELGEPGPYGSIQWHAWDLWHRWKHLLKHNPNPIGEREG